MKIRSFLKPYIWSALIAPLCMFVEVFCSLRLPKKMELIVDVAIPSGDMDQIVSLGLEMLFLSLIGAVGGILCSVFAAYTSRSFSRDLRNASFERVMRLSLAQTDRFTTGSLITRLTNDVDTLQMIVAMGLRMFVRAPLMFISALIYAVGISYKFGIILLISLPIELIVVFRIIRKANPMFGDVQEKLDRVNTVVQENVTGARVVKAYVREDYEEARFSVANGELRDRNLNVLELMSIISPIMMIVMNLSVIAVIYFGEMDVVTVGGMKIGNVMEGVTYVTQILNSVLMVSNIFQHISRASVSARRVRSVLNEDPEIVGGERQAIDGSAISFEGVSFSYPTMKNKPVLHDINLEIKDGEFVAVVGSTGSGKSTLLSLIPRFYDPTEGKVSVGGHDVREYALSPLREGIGYVLQKSELFVGTIADNIRWGKVDASDDEVTEAARIAQADGFIRSFDAAYDTEVAEKGMSLSGGQKQRVAIARALVRAPRILLFDDSTSALDLATEKALLDAIRSTFKGTTILMVAQRIASIRSADRIALLENGTITYCLPHDELLKVSETYRAIYQSQMNGGDSNG